MPLSRERMREYMRQRRAADPGRAKRQSRGDYERMKAREAADPSLRERREAKQRQWHEENRERVAERARIRYEALRVDPVSAEELRARNRDGMLRYRGNPKNRQKVRARWITGAAIRRGKLKRQPCEVCGSPYSESHHEDYSRPFAIAWLCRKHHRERHRKDAASRSDHDKVESATGGGDSGLRLVQGGAASR